MDDIRLNLDCKVLELDREKDLYTLSISKTATPQECTVTLVSQINYFDRIDPLKHIIQWRNITKISFVKMPESPETFGLRLFHYNGKETKVTNQSIPFEKSYFLYNSNTQPTVGRLEIQEQEIRDSIDFDEWKQFGWIYTETADSIVFESTNKHPQKPSEEGNKQPEKLITTAKNAQELLKLKVNWNYYEVLGIEPHAQERDIKKAFNKKIVKWHTDKHPMMSNELRELMQTCAAVITTAWKVLTDHEVLGSRRAHDNEIKAGGFTYVTINGNQIRVNTWVEKWHLWKIAVPDDFVPFKTTSPFRYFIEL